MKKAVYEANLELKSCLSAKCIASTEKLVALRF